jgi:iron complex transport system ATP-binding protein
VSEALTAGGLTVPGRIAGLGFSLRRGSLVVVVGPNGAGKSTLLQAAAGLLESSGGVAWGGEDPRRIPVLDRARRLAWVGQETRFDFAFTVREVVAQGRHMWNDDGRGVEEALAALDLQALADRPVTRLSGGERQRVLLARALATGAPLQLWDEPVAQLDVRHSLEVLALARRLADGGSTLVLTIHDLRLAWRFDQVLVLQGGRLVGDGPPAAVLTPEKILAVFGVRASTGPSLNLELPP